MSQGFEDNYEASMPRSMPFADPCATFPWPVANSRDNPGQLNTNWLQEDVVREGEEPLVNQGQDIGSFHYGPKLPDRIIFH